MTNPIPWRELDYLTPRQIAQILNVHQNTVYEIIQHIPHIMIGRTYRIAVGAFEKWLKDQERKCRA